MLPSSTLGNVQLNNGTGTNQSWHKKIIDKKNEFRQRFEQCDLDDPKIERRVDVAVAASKVAFSMTTGLAIPPIIPVGDIAKDTLKGTQSFLISMSQSEQSGERWLKRVNKASNEAWNELNKDGWKKNVMRYAGAGAKGLIAETIFDSLVSSVEPFVDPVLKGIQSFAEPLISRAATIIEPVVIGARSITEPAINQLRSITEPGISQLRSITEPGINQLRSITEPMMNEIEANLSAAANGDSVIFPSDQPLAAFTKEMLTDRLENLLFNRETAAAADTDSGTPTIDNGMSENEPLNMPIAPESINEANNHSEIPEQLNSNVVQPSVIDSSLTGQQTLHTIRGNNNTMHESKRDYTVLNSPVFSNGALYDEDVIQVIKKLEESITVTNDAVHKFIDKSKEMVATKGGQFIKDWAILIKESYNERVGLLHKDFDDWGNDYREYLNRYHEEEAERDEHDELIRNTISAFDHLMPYNSDIPDGPASKLREEEEKELISEDLKNAANICANANEELYNMLLDFVQNREIECISYGVCNFAVPYMYSVDALVEELFDISSEGQMKRQERSDDAKKSALAAADARIATTAKEQLERSNKTKAAWSILGQKKK